MNEIIDFWKDDEFEETVASTLIACYESKVLKNRHAGKTALKEKHMKYIRDRVIYIPSPSRLFETKDGILRTFDTKNDPLPDVASVAMLSKNMRKTLVKESYLTAGVIYKTNKWEGNFTPMGKGTNYKVYFVDFNNRGIFGAFHYITVTDDGEIWPFNGSVTCNTKFGNTKILQSDYEPQVLWDYVNFAGYTLQSWADKRFCWQIQATEGQAKVKIGCMQEEIKSLLYARNLPLTATGRKRPILHVVSAHKRRMKSGHEVDISGFLRGSQEVVIDNTQFKIIPPKFSDLELSEKARENYNISELAVSR